MTRIAIVAGARPNFMKIAPILRALERYPQITPCLIHTGQHYDANLSTIFFQDLGIRSPDVSLNIGSGSHAKQTADIMVALEQLFVDAQARHESFDGVLVVGDVNSTMAAALAASKLCIPVIHVEAGLRSGDRTMPEEINRIVTDSISDLLLCSEPAGVENLLREGHPKSRVHLVGNVMIDTLMTQVQRAKAQNTLQQFSLEPGRYCFVTMHRPSNVDQPDTLKSLLSVLAEISQRIPIIFPMHPRTRSRIEQFHLQSILQDAPNCKVIEPVGYLDCLCLTSQAKALVTDSGGLQEESTALGVPCLTMRDTTERPITCSDGTSTLIGNSPDLLRTNLNLIMNGSYHPGSCPELWDGKASERIAELLNRQFP